MCAPGGSSYVRHMTCSRIIRMLAFATLLGVGATFGFRDGIVAGVIVFVLVVPFEKLFRRHDQRLRRPGLGTDLAHVVARPVLAPVGLVVAVVVGALSFAWLPGLALRPIVGALPGWARVAAGVALFDLAAYWAHRWSHEVPFLWRFHSVHHSAAHLDWVSGFRVHPADGALLAPPFVLLLGAGFTPATVGALAVVQGVVGLFLHANVRWPAPAPAGRRHPRVPPLAPRQRPRRVVDQLLGPAAGVGPGVRHLSRARRSPPAGLRDRHPGAGRPRRPAHLAAAGPASTRLGPPPSGGYRPPYRDRGPAGSGAGVALDHPAAAPRPRPLLIPS